MSALGNLNEDLEGRKIKSIGFDQKIDVIGGVRYVIYRKDVAVVFQNQTSKTPQSEIIKKRMGKNASHIQ